MGMKHRGLWYHHTRWRFLGCGFHLNRFAPSPNVTWCFARNSEKRSSSALKKHMWMRCMFHGFFFIKFPEVLCLISCTIYKMISMYTRILRIYTYIYIHIIYTYSKIYTHICIHPLWAKKKNDFFTEAPISRQWPSKLLGDRWTSGKSKEKGEN